MDYLDEVRGLYRYYCYHVYNKGRKEKDLMWRPSRFHIFLCDKVQEFIEKKTDRAYEILIINTPPQHGKSKTVSECLPSWLLGRYPDKKVILASYGDILARKFGKANLDKVKEFGHLFDIEVDKSATSSKKFQIKGHEGVMLSVGYGSGITGNPADYIIIDDPVKNRVEADSEKDREKKWADYIDSIESRISAGGKLILIMTRWHEDDLAGRLMEHYYDRCTILNLPCEAEEDDILGRRVGEPLCPEIGKGAEWLKDFKSIHLHEEGIRSWNALYQGRPTALEGNVLKREWWEYYDYSDYEDGKLSFDNMIMSVDSSFKDMKHNDFVAIEVWAKKGNRLYMVETVNEHLSFTDTLRKIKVIRAKYPDITATLIEDKANGSAVIEVLKNEIFGLIAVQPSASKEDRVNAVSFLIEAGNVYLPRDKKMTWAFIDQCSAFPNGKHDDMVDAMCYALMRISKMKAFKKIMKRSKGIEGFNLPVARIRKASERGEYINVI